MALGDKQTKIVLDTEPDVQRRLARIAVGARREATAGLLAATVLALAVCVLAMGTPWLFTAIDTTKSPLSGTLLGILAHLLAVPPAVALGALASRAVTRSTLTGVSVLVVSAVLVVILGLSGSFAPWLVPPVMATARELNGDTVPPPANLLLVSVWAVVWCAVALTFYGRLRRTRS